MRSRRSSLVALAGLLALAAACSSDPAATGSSDFDTDSNADATDLLADVAPDDTAPDALPDAPTPDTSSDSSADVDEPEVTLPPADNVVLELAPVDLWGQALLDDTLTLAGPGDAAPVPVDERPLSTLTLTEPGRYDVTLDAPDHLPLTVGFEYAGGGLPSAVTIDAAGRTGFEGLSVARRTVPVDGRAQVVVRLYLGLRHRWFAASGPPPHRGNRVEFLVDGEQAWARVAERVVQSTERIHAATWWWESDFELVRPLGAHPTMSREERRLNTVLWLFDHQAVAKRVLVWQDNLLESLTVDGRLEIRGETPDDDFEFMGMTNRTEGVFDWQIPPFTFGDRVRAEWPDAAAFAFDAEAPVASTEPGREVDISDLPLGISLEIQIASWHQKFMVIDGDEAFVGGMNLRQGDWDSSDHLVFDPRRMDFLSDEGDRLDVVARTALPDLGPRKDYMLYLQGPIVRDVDAVFQGRWDRQIAIARQYSENASHYELSAAPAPFEDGITAQLTATMPAPFDAYSNLESHLNAIRNAERFILIEDQYWRAPLLTEAILARMAEVPELILVVVTKPVSEWTDPACEWTYRTDEALRAAVADRYYTFQLRAFDTVETWGFDETESRFADLDTHSKLLVVDDVFMSVGSCNKNNRGFLYEGELNVAILDEAFVTAARRRVLGTYLGETVTTDDESEWLAALQAQAATNGAVWQRWDDEGHDISLDGEPLPAEYMPSGLLYPLSFGDPDDCLIEGIGPDVMK